MTTILGVSAIPKSYTNVTTSQVSSVASLDIRSLLLVLFFRSVLSYMYLDWPPANFVPATSYVIM